MMKRMILCVFLSCWLTAAWGTEAIRARMEKMFPGETVSSISPTPIPGVFEVMLGTSLFYMEENGAFAIQGDLIDLEKRVNISDARRAVARTEAFGKLNRADLIEFGPPEDKTRATLYVYTDIDCGYCRKLHREVPALNEAGIKVAYLAFPRSGLNGDSYKKAVGVWCAENRQEALTAAKSGEDVKSLECDNPVASQFELGRSMGVGGTPAVYTETGEELGGFIPAERLIKMLNEGRI